MPKGLFAPSALLLVSVSMASDDVDIVQLSPNPKKLHDYHHEHGGHQHYHHQRGRSNHSKYHGHRHDNHTAGITDGKGKGNASTTLPRAVQTNKGNGECNDPLGGTLESGCFKIATTAGTRTMTVQVPFGVGPGPFKVLIGLHGIGGKGSAICRDLEKSGVAASHILVCPDVSFKASNVEAGKATDTDDVGFVGTTLVETLAKKSNVQSDFTIYGHSNGAALTNRILIENNKTEIKAAITDKSQLDAGQYHAGDFYKGGIDNSFSIRSTTMTPRRLLLIVGAKDTVIPPGGGASSTLDMLPWDVSAKKYALEWVITPFETKTDMSTYTNISYSNGEARVDALYFEGMGHEDALTSNKQATQAIKAFIEAR